MARLLAFALLLLPTAAWARGGHGGHGGHGGGHVHGSFHSGGTIHTGGGFNNEYFGDGIDAPGSFAETNEYWSAPLDQQPDWDQRERMRGAEYGPRPASRPARPARIR